MSFQDSKIPVNIMVNVSMTHVPIQCYCEMDCKASLSDPRRLPCFVVVIFGASSCFCVNVIIYDADDDSAIV